MTELGSKLLNRYKGNDSLLYHYTSLESACKILEFNSLRLSNLLSVNDPLEFCRPNGFGFNGYGENIGKIMDELNQSLTERENTTRLLCFCQDFFCSQGDWNNEKSQNKAANFLHKGWARNRMWAQYADNHKGVCLVFDKNEFTKAFGKIKDKNPAIKILNSKKIDYTNYLDELQSELTDEINVKNKSNDYSHYFLDEDRLKYLFIKCEDYRDENEYRFAVINSSLKSPADEFCVNFGTSLKAVIYGKRFSPNPRLSISKDIEQYTIDWNCGIPELY